MKYLKKFATEAEKAAWQKGSDYAMPNVLLVDGVVTFNAPKFGVYIQHVDGKLYTTDVWTSGGFSNDDANGVAVITENASFVISKTGFDTRIKWSSDTATLVDGILTSADATVAKTDFAGFANTQLMLATDTSGAGYSCANFTFPNGAKGYLPALGEWNIAYQNKAAINSAMNIIGGTMLGSNFYYSSTQSSNYYVWGQNWESGSMDTKYKNDTGFVRAFTTI